MRTELAKSVIGTRRLVLRPLRKSDAAALFPLFSEGEVLRYLSAPPNPYTPADADDFVARGMRSAAEGGADIAFAITLKDELIGTMDLRHRPASDLQSGEGDNIGYWIGRPYWGQGLMTEAVRGLIAHTFALTRVDAIYSGAFANNSASLRVQEKIGFVRESVGTLFSKAHGRELAHVNTALARASFERLAA